MNNIEEILKKAEITPTANRILVYRKLSESSKPMSLTELEILLDTVDKSTISRTLTLFKSQGLLHSFNDGSGSTKYEICRCVDENKNNDRHVHFRCEKCGETVCLNDIKVPNVKLPEGYIIHEISYIINGECSECTKRTK